MRAALVVASLLSLGASYRTQNFVVTAPSASFAQQVGNAAEDYRRRLAIEWLGRELPPWGDICPISVDVGPGLGAGGATSFTFIQGRPTGWTMSIQGSAERVIDSVLPHEITHTIFATHFGCPLPRWADEGACTTVEHEVERTKQHNLLYEFLTTGRGIAFNRMFAMKEYPPDVLPLYSQGYSLARYLIAQGGKQKFVQYVGDGMRWGNWTKATQHHYGFESLSHLQLTWVDWVRQGCPQLPDRTAPAETLVAANNPLPVELNAPTELNSPKKSRPGPAAIADQSKSALPAAAPLQLASTSTSWYARVRDDVRTEHLSAPPQAKPTPRAVPMAQVLSRPQPPQQAQQQVIEWSQPHRPSSPNATMWR